MVASKINVKENVNDGEIELSMMDLQDVPVKDIAAIKKAHSLDLSNNHLSTLPKNFPMLVNLVKIDLSRNQLKELPENFGDLTKLKHLDLYKNQLQHLPLSFSKLTALKWLDLKDNPLVPTIAEIAGGCLDAKQCQKCAKDIVALYSKLQVKVDEERKSREEQRQKSLEENAARLKQEKKNKKAKTSRRKAPEETKVPEVDASVTPDEETPARTVTAKPSGSVSFVTFLFKCLSILTLLFGVSVIVLRVTKAKYGSTVEDKIQEFLSNVQLPKQLKDVLIVIVEYVLSVQNYVCNKTSELVGSRNVDIVLNAFTGVYQNVTRVGVEFYSKIFGK